MRVLLALFAFAAASASPVTAQEAPADAESADTIAPKNLTVPGAAQSVARNFAAGMMLERRARDYCWEYGCLIIVNETKAYEITGFHIGMPARGGGRTWGANQFGDSLKPMKATFRFKTGDSATCAIPAQFIFRHRETKEIVKVETTASLCKSPQTDSVVRLRMLRPNVIVGED